MKTIERVEFDKHAAKDWARQYLALGRGSARVYSRSVRAEGVIATVYVVVVDPTDPKRSE